MAFGPDSCDIRSLRNTPAPRLHFFQPVHGLTSVVFMTVILQARSVFNYTIDDAVIIQWFVGGIIGLFLFGIVVRVVYNSLSSESQQVAAVESAALSGLLISLGFSPFGDIAFELSQLFETITQTYVEMIASLITMETALTLIGGIITMWGRTKFWGASAFGCALAGGILIPYHQTAGVAVWGIAQILLIASTSIPSRTRGWSRGP